MAEQQSQPPQLGGATPIRAIASVNATGSASAEDSSPHPFAMIRLRFPFLLRRDLPHVADAHAEGACELVAVTNGVDDLLKLGVVQLPSRFLADYVRRLRDLLHKTIRVERLPVRDVDPGLVVGERDL